MKTIVAAVDFSAISLNAVFYAADMACIVNSNLSLVHVCPFPMALGVGEVATPLYSMDKMIEDAQEQMNELKEIVYGRTGAIKNINTEVRQGDVVTELNEYCLTQDIYAIVMGSESGTAWERMFFGAKTITALRQFTWPVIVVPPGTQFKNLRKIGLACDFRKVLETFPLKEIKTLMDEFHPEFHVLHVSTETIDFFGEETEEEFGWLQEIIGEFKPKYHFLKGKDIEKVLAEFSDKIDLDLLIVIPKKHNLASKLFEHSHSKRLVLQSHVPVMAVHE